MVSGTEALGMDDPRYRQGMAHLQMGEWRKAIQAFRELQREHPGSPAIQQALASAELKLAHDKGSRIRPKLVVIPWRQIVFGLAVLLVVSVLGWMGWNLVRNRVAKLWDEMAEARLLSDLETDCSRRLEASQLSMADLDAAEVSCKELQKAYPDNAIAIVTLERIDTEREILTLYQDGVALKEAGDCEGALVKFTELLIRRSNFGNVSRLMEECSGSLDLDALFSEAEEYYASGELRQALVKFEQLRNTDTNFQRETVESRLFEIRMSLGREILEAVPAPEEGLPQALDHFDEALKLQPRNSEAKLEQNLLEDYLAGQMLYQRGRLENAIGLLRGVYDRRPTYHRGALAVTLYDAYIRSGNEYRDRADYGSAYNQYDRACKLEVSDKAACRSLLIQISLLVTPTSTHTPTATPTPSSTPTPITPTPTPRPPTPEPPPPPLSSLRGKIVFKVSDEYPVIQSLQAEMWVMDPNGQNRRYLDTYRYYRDEYEEIRGQEAYSADGQWRAYTTGSAEETQIWLMGPDQSPRQLTFLSGLSYDPVWSTGGRIAFVSQERNGNDDIWVIQPDGLGARALTYDEGYLWDKHPSWSKDGSRIVFWSNRTGNWQVFTMDAEGRDQRNISNTDQYEWDPIWIK